MALMVFYRLQNKNVSDVLDIYKKAQEKSIELSLKLSSDFVIYNYFIQFISKTKFQFKWNLATNKHSCPVSLKYGQKT